MTIIDAHQHIWDIDRVEYPWLDGRLPELKRTFSMADATVLQRRAGVDACVLVQATDSDADTQLMFEAAASASHVAGVVAWAPLDDPQGVEHRIAAWRSAAAPVVGVRELIHDNPDPDYVLRPEVMESLTVLAEAALPFDYVTSSPHALRHVPTLVEAVPNLTVVLDHLAKPPLGLGASEAASWDSLAAHVAEHPHAYAKLSGLYSATDDPAAWNVSQIRPFVARALELFGAERLMAGSDWPVAIIAGGYERVWAGLREVLGELSASDTAHVFGATAIGVYGLRNLNSLDG